LCIERTSGYASEWDQVAFRGDPASRESIAFWLKNGRVLAGMNVNVWDVAEDIQRLVRSGKTVQTGRLANSEVSLGDLIS
jgi:3-phenylpropionate/trans-cinnamate dioxygenase ferredoxin reductase component